MKQQILYMTDEYIYFYNYRTKKKYKAILAKGIVHNGKIADVERFIKRYEGILKDNHLNLGLLGDKILILVPSTYTKADAFLLKNIFEKLNYRDVKVEYESNYYDLNREVVWINMQENYSILTYINEYQKCETVFLEKCLFETKEEFFSYVKSRVNIKDIYLIGNSKKVDDFYQLFEKKYGNKTYLFTDSETFLINRVIESKNIA